MESECREEGLDNTLKFDPPLYKQRMSKVSEIIAQEKWRHTLKKLVDFGCSEFSLFRFIKNSGIKEIAFVDIDENLLCEKVGRLEPLLMDKLRPRETPLSVSVFRGSVIDPDYRVRKTDVVTAIELVEHLYPDTLDALPYNVFSFIKPKLVIVTTPNADFNVAFNRASGAFRHPDHKFEWTRVQFEDWCTNIIQRFPDYYVEFSGLGDAPPSYPDVGFCSQVAVFTRKGTFSESYISTGFSKTCRCDKNTPCKGQGSECKLLCDCLCAFCLPDFSVGVCTYLSKNVHESSAFRPMKSESQKSFSDTDMRLSYEMPLCDTVCAINHSYNIFYKLIKNIVYPHQVDKRSESDKLLDLFKYRIRTFSHCESRFYNEEKAVCEIPLRDIMYGDVSASQKDVIHLLTEAGYNVTTCSINDTKDYCISTVPQEMEDVASSSDITDGYSSSKSSECNESAKHETESDWDEIDCIPKDVAISTPKPNTPPSATAEPSSTADLKKPILDPLFDSGYLKSPSPLDAIPLPPFPLQDNTESAETDLFDDLDTTPSFNSDDNKLHAKKFSGKEKVLGPPKLLDSNRVNELDKFHNIATTKTFLSNYMRPQNEFKRKSFKEGPEPGTSHNWRKSRRSKERDKPRLTIKSEPKEPTVLDDAKSITNCIILNSLNKIAGDENEPVAELIENLAVDEPGDDVVDAVELAEADVNVIEVPEAPAPEPQAVENGDLANNNRDNEGNNMMVNDDAQDIDEGIDLLNDNLEDLVPLLQDNHDVIENNNDPGIEIIDDENVVEGPPEADLQEPNGRNVAELDVDNSIADASREVLFDVNSEQDLLEDFDIPPQPNNDLFIDLDMGTSIVLVGVHQVTSNGTARTSEPMQTSSFPNWLLQILGTQVVPEEASQTQAATNDDPHFYCQGDGLGVHPSVIAVEVDEVEDADDETSSSEDTSSNNTVDYAEADPGPSDMFDMSSLPEESSGAASVSEDRVDVVKAEPKCSNQVDSAVHDGTVLVNNVIQLAEDEVSVRGRNVDKEAPDRSVLSSNSSVNLEPSEESLYTHLHGYPAIERIRHMDIEETVAQSASGTGNTHIPEEVDKREDLKDAHNSGIDIADSSSVSEASEYFETRTEEF